MSTPSASTGTATPPGAAEVTTGSPTNGARVAAAANLAPNSPNVPKAARSSIRHRVATSQKSVEPPLPSTTSYPSGRSSSAAMPGPHATDERPHGRLPVGRPQQGGGRAGQRVDLGLPDLGGTGAEAAVGGQQVRGNRDLVSSGHGAEDRRCRTPAVGATN